MQPTEQNVTVQYHDKLGKYLKAEKDFSGGQILLEEKANILSTPDTYSFQFESSTHAHCLETGVARYLQHMCEPNIGVTIARIPQKDGSVAQVASVSLVALKDIRGGEAVGFNYNTTEWAVSDPFECACGPTLCAKWIGGFSLLDQQQRKTLVKAVGEQYMSIGVMDNWHKLL